MLRLSWIAYNSPNTGLEQHIYRSAWLPGPEERGGGGGGRLSHPGSFLFFTTPANLALIFQLVFESLLDIDVAYARNARQDGKAAEMFQPVEVESFRSNAADEVVFTAIVVCVWWNCS